MDEKENEGRLTDDEVMRYMLSSAAPDYEWLRLYAFRASVRIRENSAEYGALTERVKVLEERLRALVKVPGYEPAGLSYVWACCLNPASAPHSVDCPWLLAKQALEEQAT